MLLSLRHKLARPRPLIEHGFLVKYVEKKSRNQLKIRFYSNSYHYIRILRASMHIYSQKHKSAAAVDL